MAITFVERASFTIKSGIVFAEAISGDEALNFAMPIASFRMMLASGQRELDAWDAQSAVVTLRPDPQNPTPKRKR